MPPAIFIGASQAQIGVGVDTAATFAVPTTARPGDLLIACVICDSTVTANDTENAEWLGSSGSSIDGASFASGGGLNVQMLVGARKLLADDGDEVSFFIDGNQTIAYPCALLVYRQINAEPAEDGYPQAAVVGYGSNGINVSTSFVCPSINAAYPTDLYVGLVWVDVDTAVTPPAGCTERLEYQESVNSFTTIQAFDFMPEATGASGTKTSTVGATRKGIAAAVMFAGERAISKPLSIAVPGTIGLPTVGV